MFLFPIYDLSLFINDVRDKNHKIYGPQKD
jgi:hypothetical protein